MAKATNKADLIKSANENFNKMLAAIDLFTIEQQEQEFTFDASAQDNAYHWKRDKNIRDVLTHLYEWHQLLLNWVKSNTEGEQRPFLPHPYTWTNYQQMNEGFWEKHQNTPYGKCIQMLKDSHTQAVGLIDKFSDEELFQKKHFKWTGTTSLAQYFHSATVAHYDWAMKKFKVYLKALKG